MNQMQRTIIAAAAAGAVSAITFHYLSKALR